MHHRRNTGHHWGHSCKFKTGGGGSPSIPKHFGRLSRFKDQLIETTFVIDIVAFYFTFISKIFIFECISLK